MPVSTDSRPNCTHCQEGGGSSERLVWRIQLDQDLLDTLVGIYPEWFNLTSTNMASAPPPPPPPPAQPPLSPPKAEVDDSPLHKSMDKNKESLKVKLMLRRPINQLVAQGILPPLKTPPAFHEQRQKLERAKMGDLLKAKIQQRPDRQELVRQHILEDVGHVDPSLAERQRMLKKCKLADTLNDQLSHRPGPLELIKKNILHTEEPIERAVKEGHIEFKATCEGKTKPPHPDHYMTLDDDSQSSEANSPQELLHGSPPRDLESMLNDLQDSPEVHTPREYQDSPPYITGSRDVIETAAAQAGIVTVVVAPSALLTAAPSPSLSLSSLSPLSSISSPPSSSLSSSSSSRTPQPHSFPAPGKDKNKKKSKTKTLPKTRTIKFHEYKGPPNAHKNSVLNASNSETSYELLLQQQQLFLQWQLEWQHKYPQIILPAQQKPADQQTQNLITVTTAPPPPPPPASQPAPSTPAPDTRPLRNLEDMKVSDLKAELKKRNLPVSGAKPQLIERLKPFSEPPNPTSHSTPASIPPSEDSLSVCNLSPAHTLDPDSPPPLTPSTPASPQTPSSIAMDTAELSEEIIREQKRKIEQLQRQLLRSQLQLQQQTTFQPQQSLNAKANLAAFLQQQQLNQQLLLLQQQQQQQPQLIGIISNNNNINNNNNTSNNKHQPVLLNQINLKTPNNHRTSSLPNFVGTFFQTVPAAAPAVVEVQPQQVQVQVKEEKQESGHLQQQQQPPQYQIKEEKPDMQHLLPPLYHDAKLLRVKPELDDMKGVKSQIVDDVLDILIKNGELPPSAAQDPFPPSLDLRELGLDIEGDEGVEGMDLGDTLPSSELMDVDTDWLESLIDQPLASPSTSHDALLQQDPFDLLNIDDQVDFRMADFGWDRVDFAT